MRRRAGSAASLRDRCIVRLRTFVMRHSTCAPAQTRATQACRAESRVPSKAPQERAPEMRADSSCRRCPTRTEMARDPDGISCGTHSGPYCQPWWQFGDGSFRRSRRKAAKESAIVQRTKCFNVGSLRGDPRPRCRGTPPKNESRAEPSLPPDTFATVGHNDPPR
jgi:hypothetical protein